MQREFWKHWTTIDFSICNVDAIQPRASEMAYRLEVRAHVIIR